MKDVTGFEKIVLGLTALFMVGCVAVFCMGVGGQNYTVTVSERAPDGEVLAQSVQADGTPDSLLSGEQIDLNSAPEADLARLPGIGETRAAAIIAYREEHGPFQSADELLAVDGIGEATLEKLRNYVKTE